MRSRSGEGRSEGDEGQDGLSWALPLDRRALRAGHRLRYPLGPRSRERPHWIVQLASTLEGSEPHEADNTHNPDHGSGSKFHGSHSGVLGPELLAQVLVAHNRSSLG